MHAWSVAVALRDRGARRPRPAVCRPRSRAPGCDPARRRRRSRAGAGRVRTVRRTRVLSAGRACGRPDAGSDGGARRGAAARRPTDDARTAADGRGGGSGRETGGVGGGGRDGVCSGCGDGRRDDHAGCHGCCDPGSPIAVGGSVRVGGSITVSDRPCTGIGLAIDRFRVAEHGATAEPRRIRVREPPAHDSPDAAASSLADADARTLPLATTVSVTPADGRAIAVRDRQSVANAIGLGPVVAVPVSGPERRRKRDPLANSVRLVERTGLPVARCVARRLAVAGPDPLRIGADRVRPARAESDLEPVGPAPRRTRLPTGRLPR